MTRAGFTVAATEAGYAADAAADEFERRIGGKGLAVAGVTHYYDPPGSGFLMFGRLLAGLTSVTYRPQGGSAEVLVQNTDYVLIEYSTASDSEPLTQPAYGLEFLTRRWTFPLAPANRRCLEVAGTWGWWLNPPGMPEDVWQAILHRAGSALLPELGSAAAVARTQRTEAGVQTSWGGDPNGGVADRWNAEFLAMARRYRVPSL
jgi:hypothetical protein